jgi:hypothetical protein
MSFRLIMRNPPGCSEKPWGLSGYPKRLRKLILIQIGGNMSTEINHEALQEMYRTVLLELLNQIHPEEPEWSVNLSVTAYVRDGRLVNKSGKIMLHTGGYPVTKSIADEVETLEVRLQKSGEWDICLVENGKEIKHEG